MPAPGCAKSDNVAVEISARVVAAKLQPSFIPEFDIDERALPIGAALLAQTALKFVRGELS
jgi:hypothetical protein